MAELPQDEDAEAARVAVESNLAHRDGSERIVATVRTLDALVAVSGSRLFIHDGAEMTLDVLISDVRRIQFDIEKDRPATMSIVPENPADEPQVIGIASDQYRAAGVVIALVGERLAALRQN